MRRATAAVQKTRALAKMRSPPEEKAKQGRDWSAVRAKTVAETPTSRDREERRRFLHPISGWPRRGSRPIPAAARRRRWLSTGAEQHSGQDANFASVGKDCHGMGIAFRFDHPDERAGYHVGDKPRTT